MAQAEHAEFIQLTEQLRAKAEKHGDTKFAEALSHCALHASGGNTCPMGHLILQDYLKSGKLPQYESPAPSGLVMPEPTELHRQNLIDHLHHAVKDKAVLREDHEYMEALRDCEHFMETSEQCPLHRLLNGGA